MPVYKQGHQVKKTPLPSKPVFRKRRSFKRQGSQLHGKAKQTSSWLGKFPQHNDSEIRSYCDEMLGLMLHLFASTESVVLVI